MCGGGEASNGYVVSVQIMNTSLCNVPKTVDWRDGLAKSRAPRLNEVQAFQQEHRVMKRPVWTLKPQFILSLIKPSEHFSSFVFVGTVSEVSSSLWISFSPSFLSSLLLSRPVLDKHWYVAFCMFFPSHCSSSSISLILPLFDDCRPNYTSMNRMNMYTAYACDTY